ncbi:phage baseplate protein [Tropicimonas sp. IMCC34011]|uniref:phage baseplate protein n=1 Tax=Tropicimonas sp. IMCC34011 TaxID=2248759 RepID=UPI000E253256|nr:hypothetical protein [Tropicimonas sp. IMCC34011]
MSAIIVSPVAVLPIPVTVSEQHVSTLEMTENPVETGASMVDHAYRKPRKITLDSALPLPQATWQVIKRIQQDRRPFTLVTGLDVYRSMLIKDVSVTRDPGSALILAASIQLQEALLVETSRFAVQGGTGAAPSTAGGASTPSAEKAASDTPTQSRTASTVHRGDTPLQDAVTEGPSPEAKRHRSILAGILQ